MRLVSLSIGLPRQVDWNGGPTATGIYKSPVTGRIPLRRLNLDGDRQADLTVHGGPYKAVYCYPNEHYAYWREQLPGRDLPFGSFGENFTTEGLLESTVHIGDRFAVGTAEVAVTQPRLPCFKLGIRFGNPLMIKRFLQSRRVGFYVSVTREGEVAAGDEITRVFEHPQAISIADILQIYLTESLTGAEITKLHQALKLDNLPGTWKEEFRERLANEQP